MSRSLTQVAERASTQPTPGARNRRLGLISVIACLGGLLFGYDTGVSNGAERPMQLELGLTGMEVGVVISSLIFSAGLGALTGGRIADAIGRRRTIILLSILFFAGALTVVFSPDVTILITGRVLLGLAVGGASAVVPVYLAEMAPLEIRGSIAGRNEVALVAGQLLAFVVNAVIGHTWGHIEGVWRIMFALCAVPAVFLFVGMLRMPESPRWLAEHGRQREALEVLNSVRPLEQAAAELQDIQRIARKDAAQRRISLRAVWSSPPLLKILLIGIGVALAQNLTGIVSVMFYGQRILIDAGFDEGSALTANVVSGVVAVAGGLFALRNMDRLDRRTTFIVGLSLTTSFHLLIAAASMILPEGDPSRPYVLLVLIVGFVFSMQAFLNVAVWVWLAEIFPARMRGLGAGISIFFGWITNGFLALFVPTLIEQIRISGTFFLFALVGAVMLVFVVRSVPETRGVTLEKLDEDVSTGAIHTVLREKKTRRQQASE
ncbi:sugar porter family MFS transporter [Paenarthrobacter nicotinovorans]|uniref:sugar porter family MFS transporter n=1 Tax=Paenarthrobacter nicotinovorans TaxID=29320 RepID=UPI0038084C37